MSTRYRTHARPNAKRNLVRLQVEELESRVLLSAAALHDPRSADLDFSPALSSGTAASAVPVTLPASADYSSLPGAPANIYLNFCGDFQAQWGSYSNIATPAYDIDGDPSTFSSTELANIYRIWSQVAEDYAPFNVNVTTIAPSNMSHGVTQKVDIGGNSSWTGATYGGLTYIGSFANASLPNTSYVFSSNLNNGDPNDTADSAAHEAGHGFGLQHQAQWSGTTLVNQYYAGPGDGTAPLMGYAYSGHGLWWYGTSVLGSTTYQNDMAVIASATNGFGYRPEAAGNTSATAAPLSLSGSSVSGSGVIESYTDLNYWAFTTNAGSISLNVSVPTTIHNLVAKAELVNAQGNVVVAWQGPNSSGGTSITATVAAGKYYLVVGSNGPSSGSTSTNYGFQVGQYSISGTIAAATTSVAAPTSLTAVAASTSQVNLQWTNNAANATGFTVQRSTDGVNWSTIANLGAGTTSYADVGLAAGTTYQYRVSALAGTISSTYSNTATATTLNTVPAAPSTLDYHTGFAGATGLTLNGSAKVSATDLRLTDGGSNEAGSAFSSSAVGIATFSTQFSFQLTNPNADGFTFTIQGNSPTALGGAGGYLGYAGIGKSVALKFDLYNNAGEGSDSTGLYTNGVNPFTPAVDLTNTGIDLHSGHIFNVSLSYDGVTLTEQITDTVTNASFSHSYSVNIPGLVGGTQAFVGFSGGTGGLTATQDILSWTFIPSAATLPAAPTNLTATAQSGPQVSLSWTDNSNNETGFKIDRATDAGFTQNLVTVAAPANVGATASYVDTTVTAGTTYFYRVRATNSAGDSANTNSATVTVPTPPAAPGLNFSTGFAGASGLTLNGSAKVSGADLRLTDGGSNEAGSVFATNAIGVAKFTTQFTFQLTNPNADGFTFTIQGKAPTALGGTGGYLGYAGIASSLAIKFDLYNNAGEGNDSTGLYTGGTAPFGNAVDLTGTGINLHSGDVFSVTLSYDGTTLTEQITDTVTKATFSHSYTVNIPALVGGTQAFVGFTGGTGGLTATQDILSWTYTPLA
jgi:hypothetical protein